MENTVLRLLREILYQATRTHRRLQAAALVQFHSSTVPKHGPPQGNPFSSLYSRMKARETGFAAATGALTSPLGAAMHAYYATARAAEQSDAVGEVSGVLSYPRVQQNREIQKASKTFRGCARRADYGAGAKSNMASLVSRLTGVGMRFISTSVRRAPASRSGELTTQGRGDQSPPPKPQGSTSAEQTSGIESQVTRGGAAFLHTPSRTISTRLRGIFT